MRIFLVSLLLVALSAWGCTSQPEGELTTQSRSDLSHGLGSEQFAGGFSPRNAPYGGFGGGVCKTERTPVIFINGNGATAEQWDFESPNTSVSVYDAFRQAGYNECELFGVNWLSPAEVENAVANYHTPTKRDILEDFIRDVILYTGAEEVDIVGHSMGVTLGLEAVEHGNYWNNVRRFVNIAGALRGLSSCLVLGPANPAYPTCGSQNFFNSHIFGFHPPAFYAYNPRMGYAGFRATPRGLDTQFYSINAGVNDQFQCAAFAFTPGCERTGYFNDYDNVRAQVDIGYGSLSLSAQGGGDEDGVGHFRARNNSGPILVHMLNSECTGEDCCPDSYTDPCGL